MTTFQMLDGGNSEAQDRLATSFLLAQTSPGLATTGVLAGLAVTQTTTASGAVLVAAGAAPVQASVGTGVALLVNDTQATLDVFTANPMGGLPRNDVVAFDSITKANITIIGTPNAAPTDPTVPATACALARLRHAASATTIPTAKIDDLRVFTSLALGGAWTAYTPAWTNLTVGNGSQVARYTQVGKTVHAAVNLTLGSTSAIYGAVYVAPPVVASATYPVSHALMGAVSMFDTSAGARRVGGLFRSATAVHLIVADGTQLSATTPWAWAVGDIISLNLTYEAA